MRTKDLRIGDVVFASRPYEGGKGEATVIALAPGRVVVRFLPGSIGVHRDRDYELHPARIYRLVRPYTDPDPVPIGGH